MQLCLALLIAVARADSCAQGTCRNSPEIRGGSQLIQTGKIREVQQRTQSRERRQTWDPDLLERPCLQAWMGETNTSRQEVCSDAPSNSIKDDKGNYIQFTRWEDRLMYKVWLNALNDCTKGIGPVRDIISGFAHRQTCFSSNQTAMADEDFMHIPAKILKDGEIVVNGTEKVLCPGDSKTANQAQLTEQMVLLWKLVNQYDDEPPNTPEKRLLCKEMLEAHTLEKYSFVGVLHSTRPAACNPSADFFDESLCKAAEEFLTTFQERDLFVTDADSGGFKGRAADGENERSETCMQNETLKGEEWFEHKVTFVGSTTELCHIYTFESVFTEPVLKVGVYHEYQSDNNVGDAYRQCGAPFVAGVSATMPQYMASVAAGPTKKGKPLNEALDKKEILILMSMLELGGFHAMTGLSLAVNFFFKDLIVTPPFDSGAFDAAHDTEGIRCHDHKTSCCTNATKVGGFYNHQVYSQMMQSWTEIIDAEWPPPGHTPSSTSAPEPVNTSTSAPEPVNTSTSAPEPKNSAHGTAAVSFLGMVMLGAVQI